PAGHYPHFTGAADEAGGGPGRGATRNLPLPDGIGDDAYLDALAEALALVAAFRPATLVVSAGFDTFAGDPLGAFAVTNGGSPHRRLPARRPRPARPRPADPAGPGGRLRPGGPRGQRGRPAGRVRRPRLTGRTGRPGALRGMS